MLLQNQLSLAKSPRQLTPALYQFNLQGFSASTSWAVSTSGTPIEGNLMVLCLGGSQSRTTTLAGWNIVPMAGATFTLDVCWKFAGAGESTSINPTFNANLQGSSQYFEFRNIDPGAPVIGGLATAVGYSAVTTKSWGSYEVGEPSVYIQNINNAASVASISIDNGYTIGTPSGRHSAAWKIFSNEGITPAEFATWTFSSASGNVGIIAFRGKVI